MSPADLPRLTLPKPGAALWAILALTSVLGLVTAGSHDAAEALFGVLACAMAQAIREPWRIVSGAILAAPPGRYSMLVFATLGLYFLGAPLEMRWRSGRFLRFFLYSAGLANLIAVAADRCLPFAAGARFHPELIYGPSAAIAAMSAAWAREFAQTTVRLFFVVPLRAKTFVWIALALCVVNFVYPEGAPEGAVAPFGGLLAGWWLSGSPSPARNLWLRIRLLWLRHAKKSVASRRPGSPARARKASSSLRLLPGGLEDIEDLLENRTPPKDKNRLN
jgi:membrane associated rhomboid family serine protease